MREYAASPTFVVPKAGNLTDDVVRNAERYGDLVGFRRRVGPGWRDVTWAEFLVDVTATAKGLIGAGVACGQRVALMSRTRYEWTVLDYAIWFTGAVTVPIYATSSTEQVRWVLESSQAVLVVAETAEHAARIDDARSGLADLRRVVCLEGGGLAELVRAGSGLADATVQDRRREATPDTLATVVYTSGTTGRPRGCCLTHGNVMFQGGVATSLLPELFDADAASTLLFLPLAHVFARVVGVACVQARVRVGHTAEITDLLDDLRSFSPTFVLAVPRVFETVFNTASRRAATNGKARLFGAAVSTAVAYSRASDGSGPGLLLRGRHRVFDRLVYAKLRTALGGRLRWAVSGGAPFGERLAHFYRGAGVAVLEGYGLTETTAAVTVNLPRIQRGGSVGRPLPGTTVRVADDGELVMRGSQVFAGYWRDEQSTAECLVDGWFFTGDVGEVDDDGFVRVTGRKKEVLVTAGGKNVAPGVLEDRVRASPLVGQCMVVSESRPFVAALITLDSRAVTAWLAARRRTATIADLVHDPQMLAEVQRAVDDANASVSRAEAIRTFAILTAEWSEETGELTPTLELRRSLVAAKFAADVEALYL